MEEIGFEHVWLSRLRATNCHPPPAAGPQQAAPPTLRLRRGREGLDIPAADGAVARPGDARPAELVGARLRCSDLVHQRSTQHAVELAQLAAAALARAAKAVWARCRLRRFRLPVECSCSSSGSSGARHLIEGARLTTTASDLQLRHLLCKRASSSCCCTCCICFRS